MTERFTLGILETGRPPETLAGRFPSYAQMFAAMVDATAPAHWHYRHYSPLDGEFPQDCTECQAWLITGSKFDAYGNDDWVVALRRFIKEAYDTGVPMVGICFGHQILAQSLGGRVAKSQRGWGVGRHSYQWSADKPDWLTNTALADQDDFSILAFHQDQIVDLPADAQVIASSDFCPYAALSYGEQLISFQGHPEFDTNFVANLIEDRRAPVLGDAVADKATPTLAAPLDREAIGAGIVEFLKARELDWKSKSIAKVGKQG